VAKHVFGFKVTAATPMPNRIVNVASDGFSLDTSGNPPCAERDFRATTLGPAPLFKPVADEFWIIKNGIEIFRDSFNDGVLPPSGPDGAATYSVNGPGGMTSESNGKLTMTPAAGDPVVITTTTADVATGILRSLTTDAADPNFLGVESAFEMHGLFDLASLPTTNGQSFQVRATDRAPGLGNAGNNAYSLLVGTSSVTGNTVVTVRLDNFVANTSTVIGSVSIQSWVGKADQIELVWAKAAGSAQLTPSYKVYQRGNLLFTGSLGIDTPMTIYDGETYIRAQIIATDRLVKSGAVATVTSAVTNLGRPFGAAVRNGIAYVPDPSAHRVWKIDLATGSKSVVAGTGDQGFNGDGIDATLAQLDNPSGVAVDSNGALYIADTGNHAIRKIAQPGAPGALISTVAGIPTLYAVGESTLPQCANPPPGFDLSQCAQATSLRLFGPRGVAVDGANRVYIADRMNQQIKRLDPATGYLFVVAGVAGITGNSGGSGVCVPGNPDCVAATFNSPVGVAVDADGANIYVADEGNNRVRRISEGFVTTFSAGPLLRPTGVAVAPNGDVYVADYGRHRIQRVSPCLATCDAPLVTTVAGVDGTPGASAPTGPATSVLLNSPIGVAFDSGVLYIADMLNARLLGVQFTTP
jgi:sugar lactone lactonase YvrE